MIIGVPREIKDNEYRVALVPAGALHLTGRGHRVLVEEGAGAGSGIADQEYVRAGAEIVDRHALYAGSRLILKVKEPLPSEFPLLQPGHILFTFLHLASDLLLTQTLAERGCTAIAYETIAVGATLPLLTPMSEVAGKLAVQVGVSYLGRDRGGRGILIGGVPGVARGRVAILGGGTVGTNAAKVAIGLGAEVTVIDIDLHRLAYLDDIFGDTVETLMSNEYNVAEAVGRSELVVGAVLVPGRRAPVLVREEHVRGMRPGSVIVDVAVDQGGCVATTRPSSHSQPVYTLHDVIHYAVPNMPGIVPRTSTFALTNATLPFVSALADRGLGEALSLDHGLRSGVNLLHGTLCHPGVAAAHGLLWQPLDEVLRNA
jgi:alanine dehydrogenase